MAASVEGKSVAGSRFTFEVPDSSNGPVAKIPEELEKDNEALKIADQYEDKAAMDDYIRTEVVGAEAGKDNPPLAEKPAGQLVINIEKPAEPEESKSPMEPESSNITLQPDNRELEQIGSVPVANITDSVEIPASAPKIDVTAPEATAETGSGGEQVDEHIKEEATPVSIEEPKAIESDPNKEILEQILTDLGKEIIAKFEEYKGSENAGRRKEIANEAGSEVLESQKNISEKNLGSYLESGEVSELVKSILSKFSTRIIIFQETEKIEQRIGKELNLSSLETLDSTEFGKIFCQSLGDFDNNMTEGSKLTDFLVDFVESLLSLRFTEKQSSMDQIKKDMSREELGKVLIGLAKEEMEQYGFVPDTVTLNSVYENKFGEFLKSCSLFDLKVMIHQNEIIMEAAEKKQIDNIVRLTQAFDQYLRAKKEEKEKKTREFLASRLEKMAA